MAQDDEREVLTSLPRTRPQRRSAKRDAAQAKAAARPAAKKAAPVAPRKARAKPPTAAKAAAAPKAAPKARAAAKAKPKAPTSLGPRRADKKPPARRVPAAGYAPRRGDAPPVPQGAELLGTAVQAAGELAQIGLAVGGQALKSALGRLGRR
jgi:hypothetical protein